MSLPFVSLEKTRHARLRFNKVWILFHKSLCSNCLSNVSLLILSTSHSFFNIFVGVIDNLKKRERIVSYIQLINCDTV